MIKVLLMLLLACNVSLVSAQYAPRTLHDYATVTSVQPVVEDRVVGQNCSLPSQERSNTGAVLGAIGGAILGSQVGKGTGRVAGAAVGGATGAIVGDRIDNRPSTRCQDVVQQFTKGYNYTAEYHGVNVNGFTSRRISVGSTVRVNVVTSVTPAE